MATDPNVPSIGRHTTLSKIGKMSQDFLMKWTSKSVEANIDICQQFLIIVTRTKPQFTIHIQDIGLDRIDSCGVKSVVELIQYKYSVF